MAAAVGTSVVTAGPAAAAPLVPIYLPYGPERVYDSREEVGRIVRYETRNLLDGFAFPEDAALLLQRHAHWNPVLQGLPVGVALPRRSRRPAQDQVFLISPTGSDSVRC